MSEMLSIVIVAFTPSRPPAIPLVNDDTLTPALGHAHYHSTNSSFTERPPPHASTNPDLYTSSYNALDPTDRVNQPAADGGHSRPAVVTAGSARGTPGPSIERTTVRSLVGHAIGARRILAALPLCLTATVPPLGRCVGVVRSCMASLISGATRIGSSSSDKIP